MKLGRASGNDQKRRNAELLFSVDGLCIRGTLSLPPNAGKWQAMDAWVTKTKALHEFQRRTSVHEGHLSPLVLPPASVGEAARQRNSQQRY